MSYLPAIELPEMYQIEEHWPVLASLAIFEILLSTENMLGVAALADHLPEKSRGLALKLGSLGAYVARAIALLVAAPLISMFVVAKVIGALYLIYITTAHFTGNRSKSDVSAKSHWSFGKTLGSIFLLDLLLSLDNIVAAVSLSRQVWIVFSSILFGIVFVQLLGSFTLKLVRKVSILADSVFVLVGLVGVLLLIETTLKTLQIAHLTDLQKFLLIVEIIFATLIYDSVPALQKVLDPVLKRVFLPVLRAIHAPLSILFWPVRKLTALAHGG